MNYHDATIFVAGGAAGILGMTAARLFNWLNRWLDARDHVVYVRPGDYTMTGIARRRQLKTVKSGTGDFVLTGVARHPF